MRELARSTRLILCLISLAFLSASPASAGGNSGVVKLGRVEALPDGTVRIFAKTGYTFSNPDACPDTYMITINKAETRFTAHPDSFDRIYSAALSALVAQSDIHFWLEGCTAGPNGKSVPSVYSATIHSS